MVNSDILQIKCPWCGSVLSVKNRPDIETKNVTCPVCKQKTPFSQYTLVSPKVAPVPQPAVPNPYEGTQYESSVGNFGMSPVQSLPTAAIGQLDMVSTGAAFQLSQGRNVIGRKAPGSPANHQIDTTPSKRMSRQHIVIDVDVNPMQGVTHSISLFKEACNAVTVNGQPLMFGDRIILLDGATITLPDATLIFHLPDPEKTIL